MARWFTRFAITGGNGTTFLVRYTLLKTERFAIRLHHFLRSDEDKCLHDHPWPFVSIILRGGYYEETEEGTHWRRRGSVLRRPAEWRHRVLIPYGRHAWTLVITGTECRNWGFWTNEGWRSWRIFLDLKRQKHPQC